LACLYATCVALALHLTKKVTSPQMIKIATTVDIDFASHAMTFHHRKHQSVRVIRPVARLMSGSESLPVAAITAPLTERRQMKAKLSEEELDLIDEALIRHGAYLKRFSHDEQAKRVTLVMQKIQAVQSVSKSRSVMMEPFE